MTNKLTLQALHDIPMISPGDNLGEIISIALKGSGLTLRDGDILVLAQKIVSKATNCLVDLRTIKPSDKAKDLALATKKDPRLVEVILSESKSIVRQARGVLITEHRLGWIMANAGIDASNIDSDGSGDTVLLLPKDPDRFCRELRQQIYQNFQVNVGVLINDSFGRPFRIGTTGVALGAAGLPSIWDQRGETDLFGRELQVSQQAVADELAAAASLLQGQGSEGQPVVLIRGLELGASTRPPTYPAVDLIRDPSEDLFR